MDTAINDNDSFFRIHLQRFAKMSKIKEAYRHPSVPDRLFLPEYVHPEETDCILHDKSYVVERPFRDPTEIHVHYGTILSGDLVMKSGEIRDEISEKFYDALCFEMEAAGLMDTFPCLVIRGICDYSDSHKNNDWQEYAAATAASYARQLLLIMAERVIEDLKQSLASGATSTEGNSEATASQAVEKQPGNSTNVTFSGSNNSGFQLGQNSGSISGITFG